MPPALSPRTLLDFCQGLDLSLNEVEAGQLYVYLELLLKWNNKINLTAASHWQQAVRDLVADSFELNSFVRGLPLPEDEARRPVSWDLGAGGGLPGIPLRILWPAGTFHLIELREKRALFLQTVLARLRLPATFARRDDAAAFMRGQIAVNAPADLILSRAFMPWKDLLPYVRPFLASAGILLLMQRGDVFPFEIAGWRLVKQHSYPSPGGLRQFVALTPASHADGE